MEIVIQDLSERRADFRAYYTDLRMDQVSPLLEHYRRQPNWLVKKLQKIIISEGHAVPVLVDGDGRVLGGDAVILASKLIEVDSVSAIVTSENNPGDLFDFNSSYVYRLSNVLADYVSIGDDGASIICERILTDLLHSYVSFRYGRVEFSKRPALELVSNGGSQCLH